MFSGRAFAETLRSIRSIRRRGCFELTQQQTRPALQCAALAWSASIAAYSPSLPFPPLVPTRSRRLDAGRKPTARDAAMVIFSLVLGFVPWRSARSRTSKLPKPLSWIRSPEARRSLIASKTALTACFACDFDIPVRSATWSTSCDVLIAAIQFLLNPGNSRRSWMKRRETSTARQLIPRTLVQLGGQQLVGRSLPARIYHTSCHSPSVCNWIINIRKPTLECDEYVIQFHPILKPAASLSRLYPQNHPSHPAVYDASPAAV